MSLPLLNLVSLLILVYLLLLLSLMLLWLHNASMNPQVENVGLYIVPRIHTTYRTARANAFSKFEKLPFASTYSEFSVADTSNVF
jgi:hypothetical protein